MAKVTVLFVIIAVASALHEPAAKKLNFGRYQYSISPDGGLIVDTLSEPKQVGYNPDGQNAYYLYTRANPSARQRLSKDSDVKSTNFKPKKKTKVIIHGWQGSAADGASTTLAKAFLQAADVNVIVVDWSAGAAGDYMAAVGNTSPSGAAVARFLSWLNKKTGSSISKYHIVGFSLGGQQAGIVGRNLGGTVPYITALDPAGPVWTHHPERFRQSDGLYTEVIHTNAGGAGYPTALGHVDFYPNGGSEMAGCAGDTTHTCNHFRSFYYFAESLTSGGFTGTRCDSVENAQRGNCRSADTLKMGGLKPKKGSKGVFHLVTNPASPFSRR